MLLEEFMERRSADAKLLGRLADVALRPDQGLQDELPLDLIPDVLQPSYRVTSPR